MLVYSGTGVSGSKWTKFGAARFLSLVIAMEVVSKVNELVLGTWVTLAMAVEVAGQLLGHEVT